MSGGSWDYAFHHFDEIGLRLSKEKQVNRRALGKHILKLSKALHDIEWVDSCDCSPGNEDNAIMEALGSNANKLIAAECIAGLNEAIEEANRVIEKLEQK